MQQPPLPPPSRSQQIASSVLTGSVVQPLSPPSLGLGSPNQLSADMTKLLAALTAGQGGSGNPVHVVVKERKSPNGLLSARPLTLRSQVKAHGFRALRAFWSLRALLLSASHLSFRCFPVNPDAFLPVVLTILSVLVENSGLVKAAPRQSEFEPHESSKPVRFSDVHGVDEAKEELKDVVAFLKDPPKFAELGGKLPKGVLLTGEPGTGKTMLARAVAGEAGVPFLFASGYVLGLCDIGFTSPTRH